MTSNRPIRRDPAVPKPYRLIEFPKQPPPLKPPAGHDRYHFARYHGSLALKLTVQTTLHISTGVVKLGSDVGEKPPLIKTMMQTGDRLTIPGSSLKGVVRSAYEAITNSTLAVVKDRKAIPKERLPCQNKEELCPASLVFGALDWQGLVQFRDAQGQPSRRSIGFMPSLYRPRSDVNLAYFRNDKAIGRKFYYHAVQAIDKGQQGIPVQQAGKEYEFLTQMRFENLTLAELGTILVILGQDPRHPIALKVGGGKPIGMGTMMVAVIAIEAFDRAALQNRYSQLEPAATPLTGDSLRQFQQTAIQEAHRSLILPTQMQQFAEVWKYPTDRTAPAGMY